MRLSRPHTPRRVLQEVKAVLPPAARAYLDWVLLEGTPRPPSTPGPPDLLIGPLPHRPNRPPPHPFTMSRLHELQPVRFQTAPRKHLYTLVLHTLHPLTLVSHPNTKWQDFCHLWRVSSPGGPAYIPPWFRGPSGTSVGSSFTEL
ncbi:unnamed protein product [Caretta caretta]